MSKTLFGCPEDTQDVLILGAFGYSAFLGLGLERASAGIAAEAVLVCLVLAWTSTYLLRVINGRMTYMEQRKRYRNIYDKLSAVQLQKQFVTVSELGQIVIGGF